MKKLKDVQPADESTLPKWFTPIWAELRRTFLIGTFIAGILIAGFNWYRATFPAAEPATATQLDKQSTSITKQVNSMQQIVHQALQDYTDSLSAVRTQVEEDMAKPILENIIKLNEQMARLQRGQVVTATAIEEQRKYSDATTAQLLERINARPPDPSAELLKEVLQRLEAQDELIRQLTEKRTSKGKF